MRSLATVTLQSQAEEIQEGIPHSLPRLPPAAPVLQWGGGYTTIPPDTALEGKDLGKGMCAAVCGHWQHCVFVLCHRLVFHAPVSLVCFCSAVLIVGTQEQPTDLQASLDCMFVFCPKFFQVEAIPCFPCGPPSVSKQNRQTTQGILCFQEGNCVKYSFIKSRPI